MTIEKIRELAEVYNVRRHSTPQEKAFIARFIDFLELVHISEETQIDIQKKEKIN